MIYKKQKLPEIQYGLTGIYEIEINKKSYIGSSLCIRTRLLQHIGDLKKQKHCNTHLQRAYNKYKESSMIIIEICSVENLLVREKYWFDIKGYYNNLDPLRYLNPINNKKVYQFTLEGDFVKEYISINDAARSINKRPAHISEACNKNQKTAHGFLWSFDKISPIYSKKEYKKIYMFNKDNTFKEFNSQNDAARFLIKSKDKEINRKNIIIMSSNIR